MTVASRLSADGENLFQGIKRVCDAAEEAGQTLTKLSIGQPTGSAFFEARKVTSHTVMSTSESVHEYQDNGSPGIPGFAERFVQVHVNSDVSKTRCLPIPGIKPMLGLVLLACGAQKGDLRVVIDPGYPTPATWCQYLRVSHRPVIWDPHNEFRFDPDKLWEGEPLLMTNYPHNPSGQVATREWWEHICAKAEKLNIRIFNDGAYSKLAYSRRHCTLADVAINFPNLSWAEAFSASKLGNFTGWRIGAIVGSPDFVEDIATIKGNTDSGFYAPAAAGVLHVVEKHPELIIEVRNRYKRRAEFLIDTLLDHGMQLAVHPGAGFFTLWETPTMAFGEKVHGAMNFNNMMIQKTGVVGVHFPPFIRYAVCGDVEASSEKISAAFKEACVQYD
jgi:LL-diaminopimelate aminotransferase